MRLGDLDALKEALVSEARDEFEFVCLSYVLDKIDNAPTVEPERPKGACCGSCYLCDVGDCGTDMRKGGAE